jgi:hypothetical protein
MDYVQTETGLIVANQEFHIASKDREMQLPDMELMSTWTMKRRKDFIFALKGSVPVLMHGAANAFTVKTREIWDPLTLKLIDVMKYCDGHPYMWDEDRVAKEAKDAGDWGKADTDDFFNDSETLCDRVAEVLVGYAESEFGTADPSPPEATVRALVARVEASVAKVNDVVSPAFHHFVRHLKMEAVIKVVDKYEAEKAARANRLRRGKDGGYGATEEEQKESEDADAIDDANNVDDDDSDDAGPAHLGLSVVDRVMGKRGGGRRPTNLHTRVANFMLATGINPETRVRVTKDHQLVVRTSAEFLNRVIGNGEIIIRDHFKPLRDRVFPPADMGGIAGVSTHEHFFDPTRPARCTYSRSTPFLPSHCTPNIQIGLIGIV